MMYYSFNKYLQEKFGQKVQRLSLDAGFNCPNLDGSLSRDGCIYCNNLGFGHYAKTNLSLKEQIKESMEFYNKKGIKKFIAYFQTFTNTYSDLKTLKERFSVIEDFKEIVGLFISTRPDCVDEEKLKLISSYMDRYLVWIEYGLQTTHNHLLKIINRNHTYEDFLKVLDITRKYKINVGVHIILGLPSSAYKDVIEDAERLSSLDIQGIKFHILHVLKDTKLEKLYNENKIKLLSKEEYVKLICDFLERIPPNFVILRLISSASKDYLIAPTWINNKLLVINKIEEEFKKRKTHQGYYCKK